MPRKPPPIGKTRPKITAEIQRLEEMLVARKDQPGFAANAEEIEARIAACRDALGTLG